MKKAYAALLAAAVLLCGCGDTSTLEEIAASGSQAAQTTAVQTTKSIAELNEPVHTTTSATTAPAVTNAAAPSDGTYDIDMTQLSSSVVYGVVYDMMNEPDKYLGQTVKMHGPFAYYKDEATGSEYFAVIISDAMACCSQGIEFVLADEHTYPDDYPEAGTEITVTGCFNSYKEGGYTYCQLTDAYMTV